jgi:HSP20 family protein
LKHTKVSHGQRWRNCQDGARRENYHVVERSYGSFARSVTLPAAVDADKIEATSKKGVLTITCPKKEVV